MKWLNSRTGEERNLMSQAESKFMKLLNYFAASQEGITMAQSNDNFMRWLDNDATYQEKIARAASISIRWIDWHVGTSQEKTTMAQLERSLMRWLDYAATSQEKISMSQAEDELIDLPVESLDEITIDRENIESKLDFNPENLTDARERTIRAIVQRQGQSKFRTELLKAYSGQCAITDCDAEAAHIFPYLGTDTNHVTNGLLLRADIHTLFDLYLISIDPDTSEIVVSSSLLNTCYKELNGKSLKPPQDYASSPSPQALARHYETFLLK